ncbi:MAG TPA: hypothetical protein VNN75_04690, partial [Stellaceae bacterium]|nr:hypothetical protein [Stellaceae bacterium]
CPGPPFEGVEIGAKPPFQARPDGIVERHTLFLGTVWSSNQTRLGRHASMPTGIERDTDARRKPTKRAQHPEILA